MVANVAGDLSYSMEDELCFFKIMRQFIDTMFDKGYLRHFP